MQLELDDHHAELVQRAVDRGDAADARSYVQHLIDGDATESWIEENRPELEALLRERLKQPGVERDPRDHDALRRRLEAVRAGQKMIA